MANHITVPGSTTVLPLPSARCHPKYIFNLDNSKLYSNLNKEFCNFTNNFLEISSLQNTPISYIYGNGDELCVFKSNDYSNDYETFLRAKLAKTHTNTNVNGETQSDINNVATNIAQTRGSESKGFKFTTSTKTHSEFTQVYFKVLNVLCNQMA
jgi:ankyrin repeat protein